MTLPKLRSLLAMIAGVGLALLATLTPASAGPVRLYVTNPQTGSLDTNYIVATPISSNILSSGQPIARGVPFRINQTASGVVTNTFGLGWYSISNRVANYVINVFDTGATVYDLTNVLESGFNTYVKTVYGTNPPPTFNELTNALNGYFATSNSLFVASNELAAAVSAVEAGGLAFEPQLGSANLTNWSQLDTNVLSSVGSGDVSAAGQNNFIGSNYFAGAVRFSGTNAYIGSSRTNSLYVNGGGGNDWTIDVKSDQYPNGELMVQDGTVKVNGDLTVSGGVFSGSGASLTAIPMTGITQPGAIHTNGMSLAATFSSTVTAPNVFVDTEIYSSSSWNNNLSVPTKDAVRDKIEALILGGGVSGAELSSATNILSVAQGYDVRKAGAIADGTTDDTAAWQLASTNKMIFLPPGMTSVVSTVWFSNDCTVFLHPNSVLLSKAASTGFMLYAVTNGAYSTPVRLFVTGGGTIMGNTATAQNTGVFQSQVSAGAREGVRLNAIGVGVGVFNIRFMHLHGSAIELDSSRTDNVNSRTNMTMIQNNWFFNNFFGVKLNYDNSDYSLVQNNLFQYNYCGVSDWGSSTMIRDNSFVDNNYHLIIAPNSSGRGFGLISGNQFNHSGRAHIYFYYSTAPWFVTANKFTVTSDDKDVFFVQSSGVTFANNQWWQGGGSTILSVTNDVSGNTNIFKNELIGATPAISGAGANSVKFLDCFNFITGAGYGGSGADWVGNHYATTYTGSGSGLTAIPMTGITQPGAIHTNGMSIAAVFGSTITGSGGGLTNVPTGSQSGVHATPTTTTPLSPGWSNSVLTVWYGATGTINLPAASGYANKGIIIYNTGAFTVTIDANGSEVIVRDGTVQTGGVSMTLSSGAGNYVSLICDGARWITLGYKGTLAAGS